MPKPELLLKTASLICPSEVVHYSKILSLFIMKDKTQNCKFPFVQYYLIDVRVVYVVACMHFVNLFCRFCTVRMGGETVFAFFDFMKFLYTHTVF